MLAACTEIAPPAEDQVSLEAPPPGVVAPGETDQGVHILGETADGMFNQVAGEHLHVRSQPIDAVHLGTTFSVTPASAGAALDSPAKTGRHWFEGAVLVDANLRWRLRIEPGTYVRGNVTRYILSRQPLGPGGTPSSPVWVPYCDGAGVGAVPLQGWYDRRRIHHLDSTISFACDLQGVADKCTDWGYPAGNAGPAPDAVPTPWNLHQTCTIMANAMYCMDGVPHTRELTPIQFGDILSNPFGMPVYPLPAPLPGDLDAFSFEAGWTPHGPVCLSKLRWRSLPPDPCPPGVLPDPRTEQGRGAGGQFCDELGYGWVTSHSLMANGSKAMDTPMYVWQSGTDTVMSVRGYYARADNLPPPKREVFSPFGGYGIASPFIDHMILRNLPGSLDEAKDMIPLYMWVGPGGDRVVARAAPAPSYTPPSNGPPVREGFSFQRSSPSVVPLRTCATPSGFITTVAPSCPGGGAGQPQGFALPAP